MRYPTRRALDTVISMFNAVGHLTESDFELAMTGIRESLAYGGLYIFDIFNASYLKHGSNIADLTIDWVRNIPDRQGIREVQFSYINQQNVLSSYTTLVIETDTGPTFSRQKQTLQTYSASALKRLLEKTGFAVVDMVNRHGEPFDEKKHDSIVTVAQKIELGKGCS